MRPRSGSCRPLTHNFPGEHALGGEHHTPEQMRRWFARLYTIFPDLHFDVRRVVVRGWPWDTTVAVEWDDHATPPDRIRYDNEGTHFIRLVRGRIVSLHAYCDSQKIADVCERLAASGLAEVSAPPIDARIAATA